MIYVLIDMETEISRPRGRPRAFDRDEALDRAVETFWAHGYSATSLDDLTGSMGINRPSLYGSFGNKHDLFLQSIDRYNATIGRRPVDAFLQQADIRKAVEAFFTTAIGCVAANDTPSGCLIMSVASVRAASDDAVREKMNQNFEERVAIMSQHIAAARDDGQLPPDTDAVNFARMMHAILHGLAARARVGASRKELRHLADGFLAVLLP